MSTQTNIVPYPSMEKILSLEPGPQVFLNKLLWWTEKRDGCQLRVWWEDGGLRVASHHQLQASGQFREYLEACPQYGALKALVSNEGAVKGVGDFGPYMVCGELLVKGKSPARYETHNAHEFVAFDLYDLEQEVWLSVPTAYQHCLHFGLPFVEVWGESKHQSLEELFCFRDKMIELATERGREGVVVKTLVEGQPLYAKEKRDVLHILVREVKKGPSQLPPLAESEALGAVAKAHTDLGEDFANKSRAMPLVAHYIEEEMKKHLCSRPPMSFFWYYTHYIEGLRELIE